jgi:hypothetical protein
LEGKRMNFLINNNPKDNQSLQISWEIASFLINQLDLSVFFVTKEKINLKVVDFDKIEKTKIAKLGLIESSNSNLLFRKLLYFENIPQDRIPQVIILDSLVS